MACKYVITSEGKENVFDDKASLLKFVRENQLLEGTEKNGKPSMDTNSLALALRQINFNEHNFNPSELKKFQTELLDKFISLESQASYFYKIGPIVAITKGLGKSFDYTDTVNNNLKDLGVGSELKNDIPFDVRYLLTGDNKYKEDNSDKYTHTITSNNVRIMNEVNMLGRTMFMERTPAFINTSEKTIANLKQNLNSNEAADLKNDLSSFSQIAAYKQWITANGKNTSTLRNSLIYDGSDLSNIVDIVRQAQELAPANTFLSYILPVSTQVKIGKKQQKNILNRDLLNTIEGKTRGKIEPDLVASLMDSFAELYQNPKTKYHAKALFDYLIVKDALQFKNKSFIKMLPTIMFQEMSEATNNATKLMAASSLNEYSKLIKELAAQNIESKEGDFIDYFTKGEKEIYNKLFKEGKIGEIRDNLYKKVFGFDSNELYNTFEKIYATDVTNQFNIALVRPIAFKGGKKAKGITFGEGGKILYVNLFDEKHKELRGTEEGNKYLKTVIDELGNAGFSTTSEKGKNKEGEDINKLSIQFKKFIIVQGAKSKKLLQLTSVFRNGKTLTGSAMTALGEQIPNGVSAQYTEVSPVGTSNTSGMANLGARPTREELMKNVDIKTQQAPVVQTDTPNNTHTTATEKEPVTPQPSADVLPPSAGIFGGLQQLAYNESSDMPLDFFTDDQIDKQTDNC